jgi:hypothetical protein
VPPEDVGHQTHGTQAECSQLKLGHREPLHATCNALNDEPGCMEDGNFREDVASGSVVDIIFCHDWEIERWVVHKVQELLVRHDFANGI